MTVLILARDIEPQVDRVVEALAARDVPVFRTDLAAFPQRLALTARLGHHGWEGELSTDRRRVDLQGIRAIWYRHPSHFELVAGLSRPEARQAAAEARVGVGGVLGSLDTLWVNYPSREADALKPRQLDVARRCGLAVPTALITNRPAAVPGFVASLGGPVAGKNLSAASLIDYPALTYTVVEPPTSVRDGMLAFMREFDLVFGAFDFAVTTTGEWIMFECNPFGAYGWLEDELGFPLTETLADVLAAGGAR